MGGALGASIGAPGRRRCRRPRRAARMVQQRPAVQERRSHGKPSCHPASDPCGAPTTTPTPLRPSPAPPRRSSLLLALLRLPSLPGALYGTYEAFRYKVPGLYKVRYIGQVRRGGVGWGGDPVPHGSRSGCLFPLMPEGLARPGPSCIASLRPCRCAPCRKRGLAYSWWALPAARSGALPPATWCARCSNARPGCCSPCTPADDPQQRGRVWPLPRRRLAAALRPQPGVLNAPGAGVGCRPTAQRRNPIPATTPVQLPV